MRRIAILAVAALDVLAAPARADEPAAAPNLQIHGFISEGGWISTANDYIGPTSSGSLELFEAGLNVSSEIADRLRAGIQLYARDMGTLKDLPPRLDWAYLDYRYKPWLGLRAGVIKMPYGLYNEYADIDAARLSILMPQGVYPLRDRSALIAHTGFALYGDLPIACAGELEYQAWLGTLNIPNNALELSGATLDSVNNPYVTGAQVFWHPPVDGLKIGATYLRAAVDYKLTLTPETLSALIMAGLVPPSYDGKVAISQRPVHIGIASAEYQLGNWLFAAEYARWFDRQTSNLALLPTVDHDTERFYAMAALRLSEQLETGAYYSVLFLDADDRGGHDKTKFPQRFDAWQRDAAVTLRFDVNDRWLWKLEAHSIDGVADLFLPDNPHPSRFWGLFLLKTTVTF